MFRMEATVPSKINPQDWIRSMKRMASETATDIRTDFEITASTFDKPVKFTKRGWLSGGTVKIGVWTDDENYKRVNDGVAGGYKIPKGGPGVLAFWTEYEPKTHPHRLKLGLIRPTDGGPGGEFIIRNTQVTAKGFEARNFDEAIRKLWEDPLKDRARLALAVPFGEHQSFQLTKSIRRFRRGAKYDASRRQ